MKEFNSWEYHPESKEMRIADLHEQIGLLLEGNTSLKKENDNLKDTITALTHDYYAAVDRADRTEAEVERLREDGYQSDQRHLGIRHRQQKQIKRLLRALKMHKHTDVCLRCAAQTGDPFCIASCQDDLEQALRGDGGEG